MVLNPDPNHGLIERVDQETIGERFERDQAAFLPLPNGEYEACEKRVARVISMSLVRYRANDYSVPTEYGHRDVLVKGYVHEVVIVCGSQGGERSPRAWPCQLPKEVVGP